MFRVVSRVSRCGLFSTVIYANLARHGRQTVHIRTVVCVCVFYEICSCCVPTCVRACVLRKIPNSRFCFNIRNQALGAAGRPAWRKGPRAIWDANICALYFHLQNDQRTVCVRMHIYTQTHTHTRTNSTVLSGAWFENINVNIQNVCQTIVLLRTTTPPPPPPTATSASTGSLFIRYSAQTT